VTVQEVEQAMRDNALDVQAGDLATLTPTLTTDQTLEEALGLLVRANRPGLPVLAADTRQVCGWLSHRDVLLAYNTHLTRSVDQALQGQQAPATPAGATAPSARSALPRDSAVGPRAEPPILDRLQGYRIIDLEIARNRPPVGQQLAHIRWPPTSLVIAVRRDGATFVPNGKTNLAAGDRLTVLVPAEHADDLADSLQQGATQPAAT
jgi:hypothetical protein